MTIDLHLLDQLAQAGIAISPVPVWMTQQKHRPDRQRFACILALLLQPAWFWTACRSDGWGLFVTSVAFTLIWLQGLWHYWLAPRLGR
jgi:hypothetical protein